MARNSNDILAADKALISRLEDLMNSPKWDELSTADKGYMIGAKAAFEVKAELHQNGIVIDREITAVEARAIKSVMDNALINGLTTPPCFSANTEILLANGSIKKICEISVGDTVLSFHESIDRGCGALEPAKVTRLFRNETDEWIELSFESGKTITTTPGHRFLTASGEFRSIDQIVKSSNSGNVELIDKNGNVVFAEFQLVKKYTDKKSNTKNDWKTYNFEVENLHTYIAEDIRVHNDCISDFLDIGEVLGIAEDLSKQGVVALGNTLNGTFDTVFANHVHGRVHFTNPLTGQSRSIDFDTREMTDAKSLTNALGDAFGGRGYDPSSGSTGVSEDPGTGYGDGMDSSPSGNPNVDQGTSHHGPIVIDLDGDGIELVSLSESETFFDVDEDNYKELTGWSDSDDGILELR